MDLSQTKITLRDSDFVTMNGESVRKGVCNDCLSYEWDQAAFDKELGVFIKCDRCHYLDRRTMQITIDPNKVH